MGLLFKKKKIELILNRKCGLFCSELTTTTTTHRQAHVHPHAHTHFPPFVHSCVQTRRVTCSYSLAFRYTDGTHLCISSSARNCPIRGSHLVPSDPGGRALSASFHSEEWMWREGVQTRGPGRTSTGNKGRCLRLGPMADTHQPSPEETTYIVHRPD